MVVVLAHLVTLVLNLLVDFKSLWKSDCNFTFCSNFKPEFIRNILTTHGNICCHFGSSFLVLDSISLPHPPRTLEERWMMAARGGLGVLVHIQCPLNFEGQGFSMWGIKRCTLCFESVDVTQLNTRSHASHDILLLKNKKTSLLYFRILSAPGHLG